MLIFWNFGALAQLFEGAGVYNWSGGSEVSAVMTPASDPVTGSRWPSVMKDGS